MEALEARDVPAFPWPNNLAWPEYNGMPPAYLAQTFVKRSYQQTLEVGAIKYTLSLEATNWWTTTLGPTGSEVTTQVGGRVTYRSEQWANQQLDPTTSTTLYLNGSGDQSLDSPTLTYVLGGGLPSSSLDLTGGITAETDWAKWTESDDYMAYTLGYVNSDYAYSFSSGTSRTSQQTTTRTVADTTTTLQTTVSGTWEDSYETARPQWFVVPQTATYDLNSGESGTYYSTRTDITRRPPGEPATASVLNNWGADGTFWNTSQTYRTYGSPDGTDSNRAFGWDRSTNAETGTITHRGGGRTD